MAIYSVGRKRVILALLLTTVLLITLDLRGNPLIDAAREGFTAAMEPVQSATGVVTNPLERAWNGIVNYDDLEQENVALQEQVDRLIGTQAAAEATVIEGQELQALYSLPSLSGIDTEVARVVGYAATNLDQVIEINKGSSSGIEVGMPVVNQAGLVGKVTRVTANTARVMLVTDARYAVTVKVTSSDGSVEDVPTNTTPSGLDPERGRSCRDHDDLDDHDHDAAGCDRSRCDVAGWRTGSGDDVARRHAGRPPVPRRAGSAADRTGGA